MRRSLAIMLSASITVHAIALTTYLFLSMAERRGASSLSGDSLALIVTTTGSKPMAKPEATQSTTPRPSSLAEVSRHLPDPVGKPLASINNEADPFPDFTPPQSPKYPLTPKTALQKTSPALNTIEIQPLTSAPPPVAKSMTASGVRSVVFLLDVSGSMYEDDGFSSRDMQARTVLTNLIAELPADERFTIVFYAETSQIASPFALATEAPRKARFTMSPCRRNVAVGRIFPWGYRLPLVSTPQKSS